MKAETPQRIETRLRSFFGMKALPFTKQLAPQNGYFHTDPFDRGLDRLRYLVDRRGTGAIFGAPGTGKSTLLRAFIESLGRTTHNVGYVAHTNCAALDLHREIARSFQLEPAYRKADVLRGIKDRLLKLSRGKKIRPVLIIDDAQLLPSTFLDDLRLLTSFDGDGRDELTLILAGHPQLESNLRLAVNEALAQRIVVRIHLRSLHPNEVERYVRFQLEQAGRTATLFLPDAIEATARGSRGIPRLIDRIAEHSLLIALDQKRKEVDAEIVTAAIDEVDP